MLRVEDEIEPLTELRAVNFTWYVGLWHILIVEFEIEPLTEMRDVNFTWYVGLDAEATRIGDALWNGRSLEEKSRSSVVGLYRLTFADSTDTAQMTGGEPVYLILAMSPGKVLRMKPQ